MLNDFIAGFVAGSLSVLVGHPLDTIKALMQTRNHASILASARIVFKETLGKGFFRGMSLPFIAYTPTSSLLFGIYGINLRLLSQNESDTSVNFDQNKEHSLRNIVISGSLAGIIQAIPKNPFEVVKVQLQTHKKQELSGLGDCVKSIYKTHGLNGFCVGGRALVCRDAVSYAVYFFLFEFLRRKSAETLLLDHADKSAHLFAVDLVCGGCAGALSWLTIMPLDVIKSQLQSDIEIGKRSATVRAKFTQIVRASGVRGLYKGTSAVVIRGFIVNAVILSSYVQTLKFINNIRSEQNV